MYTDQTINPLTASFQFINFGCTAKTIILANDDAKGANKIQFSWYGQDVDGVIPASQAITLDVSAGNGFYLRYIGGAPAYRLIVKGN